MFTRGCPRCGDAFDYCGSCQPGRVYCGENCSKPVRAVSVRGAQVRYNARETEEGRRAHREEEQKRRGAKGVGDHRCGAGVVELQGSPAAGRPGGEEINEARAQPVPAGPAAAIAAPAEHAASEDAREWVLVAWPEVLEEARSRLGHEAACPFCGRSGRIVRVVAREEWRRRYHRRVG